MKSLKINTGGDLTDVLDELEKCGFTTPYISYGLKSKGKVYKLTDPFTLFFLKFVSNNSGTENWDKISKSQAWVSWSGLAFENICHLHFNQIKKALKIEGIWSESAFWHKDNTSGDTGGAQIDLMVDRADNTINICEIKYHKNPVVLTKAMANNLRSKMALFTHFTKSKKSLIPTLIAPFGIYENEHSSGFIQHVITIDDLFQM